MTIGFLPPTGEMVPGADLDSIKPFVFSPSPQNWPKGGSDAGLHRNDGGLASQLIFNWIPDKGFYVDYEAATEDLPVVLSCQSEDDQITTWLDPSGNQRRSPMRHFVQSELLWSAILHFIETGRSDPRLTWETITEDEEPEPQDRSK